MKGDPGRARKTRTSISGEQYASEELEDDEKSSIGSGAESVHLSMLFVPKMKTVIVIGIIVAIFQQWCGIN